ncbi:MAG: acyl-CoA desaturase [Candidatus Melainabacteria bacterium]
MVGLWAVPEYATVSRFNWPLCTLYVLLHGSLLLAAPTFSWAGLVAFCVLYFMTICLGITLCYHRLLAHQSYRLPEGLTVALAFLGCLAFQRGPIWWSACHRLHHARVDRSGDPHSPKQSILWSHFLWPFFRHPQLDEDPETLRRLAGDLYQKPGLCWLERHYTAINVGFLALLFAVGYWAGGLSLGLSLLVWGGLLRILICLHFTWLVNSVAHLWGARRFDTNDTSRNNLLVALLTWGEGWHNNHHAHPRSARMGFGRFEPDVTFVVIRLLRRLGLATDVQDYLRSSG